MAWPSEAGCVAQAKRRALGIPARVAQRSRFLATPWTPPQPVATTQSRRRRRHGLGAVRRSRIEDPARFRGRFYADARGLYRRFNAAEYRFYRDSATPPAEGDAPFATNATLPHTPANTYADGTWWLAMSHYNGVIDSGLRPQGDSNAVTRRLDITAGLEVPVPPDEPTVELVPMAGGVLRVLASYSQAGSLRATEWAITYTVDGSTPGTPPAISPDVTLAFVAAANAEILEYDLPAQADGTVVKARVQTRRQDAAWTYSASQVVSGTADADGPAASLGGNAWRGRIAEGG